jgi:hypothetical protein
VSYDQVKRQRQRQLLASMHPGFPIEAPGRSDGPVSFDGGVRGDQLDRRTGSLPPGVSGPWPSSEQGWPVDKFEDGASALFPWIEGD